MGRQRSFGVTEIDGETAHCYRRPPPEVRELSPAVLSPPVHCRPPGACWCSLVREISACRDGVVAVGQRIACAGGRRRWQRTSRQSLQEEVWRTDNNNQSRSAALSNGRTPRPCLRGVAEQVPSSGQGCGVRRAGRTAWLRCYSVLCRFGDLYVLVLTGLQDKEWTALKFIDDFYDRMEVQLGQVRALHRVTA